MNPAEIERHERVRADWLLHNKGSGFAMSDQRMSNELRREAAQKARAKAGAAESAHHEARIKSFASRWIAGGEDQTDRGGRMFWAVALAGPAALAFGPMLAVSAGLYKGSTEAVLRREKNGAQQIPRAVPWLVAAAVVAVAAGAMTPLLPVKIIQPWPWNVSYELGNLAIVYLLWQLAFGVLLTAWQVRRHGWPGVKLKTAADTTGFLSMDAEPGYDPDAPVEFAEPNPEPGAEPVAEVDNAVEDKVEIEGFDDIEFEDWMAIDDEVEATDTEGKNGNV